MELSLHADGVTLAQSIQLAEGRNKVLLSGRGRARRHAGRRVTFTSRSPSSLDGSITNPSTGRFRDHFVYQYECTTAGKGGDQWLGPSR